jgi:hypothetical protein
MPVTVDPKLLGYGDTFGTYAGRNLGDTDIYSTAVDGTKLNKNTFTDTIELTDFEQTIHDYVFGMLGHPVVRVELTDFQVKIAIDQSITQLDYHAPWWLTNMATFQPTAGRNTYKLPTHIANNLSYVVYKKTLLSIPSQAGDIEGDYFLKYFQDNFLFSDFNISDYYLMQTHLETMRKVLSQDGTFDIINGNILTLYPTPVSSNQAIILVYRSIDTATLHPFYANWIQRYALAVCKGTLAQSRGKFNVLPSPGGGAQLNGSVLQEQSAREMEALKKELLTEIEEPPTFGLY